MNSQPKFIFMGQHYIINLHGTCISNSLSVVFTRNMIIDKMQCIQSQLNEPDPLANQKR